jgi:hypothetical protein
VCRTPTATDLAQSESLHRMRQQSLRGCEKLHRMRQGRMKVKRGLIHPLRANREHERLPQRLKHIEAQTPSLGSGRFIDPEQLLAKRCFPSGPWLKANDDVNGQMTIPNSKYRKGESAPRKALTDQPSCKTR